MRVDLTLAQLQLLTRLQRGSLTFTGAETDDERLAMLQLLIAGLVAQDPDQARDAAIKWCITIAGRAAIRSAQA
jgi:hypothetical protein